MEDEGAGKEVDGVGTGSMNRGARIEMRRAGKAITAMLVMILMMASMAMAQQKPAPEMSYWQAQRAIKTAMQYASVSLGNSASPPSQNSLRLTQDTVEFDSKGVHFTIPLKGLRKLTVKCNKDYFCWVKEEGSKKNCNCFLTNYNAKKRAADIYFGFFDYGRSKICSQVQNHDECMNAAPQFAAALNSLHIYALRPTTPDEEFHQQAAAWRALATKPALPDAVRVRRMMAENAIKNKKPEDALRYYEQGIESHPMWPQGCFDAALVAGELGRYDDAVYYMQHYLELAPDAKDAQSARDQLEIWKIKAQEKK
jgi:tetratricopeptide (TPR) repeat protein